MPSLHWIPLSLSLLVAGTALGALSWLAAALVSGTFEPYDSSAGLLMNQAILSVPAALLAWRYRAAMALLLLAGAYVGMNAYAYGFGGSEKGAWAVLGTLVSMLLLIAPLALMLGAIALRRLYRRQPSPDNANP